jgi:hypothetical protein
MNNLEDAPLSAKQKAIRPKPINQNPLIQQNPRATSVGIHAHRRSFTHSLESYEMAAKRVYILLVRNLEATNRCVNFHVIIGFHNPKPIKDFSNTRNKAFNSLKQWKVRGFYVHEATESTMALLHIHVAVIYDGEREDLRKLIKYAFILAGLEYDKDFHVKIQSVDSSVEDCKRLFSYILKFSGRRAIRRTPELFIKNLGLHKTGTFGKWFVKPQAVLWKEYREELQRKHEQESDKNMPQE